MPLGPGGMYDERVLCFSPRLGRVYHPTALARGRPLG